MTATPRSRGLLSSLRSLIATGVAILRTRLELLSTEVREETARLLGLAAYGVAGLLLLLTGLIFLAVFFTVLLWDSHRLLALGLAATVFLAGGIGSMAVAMRLARAGSRLFAASLAELTEDRAALEPSSPRE